MQNTFPKQTKTEIISFIQILISNGDLFVWIHNNELVSTAKFIYQNIYAVKVMQKAVYTN